MGSEQPYLAEGSQGLQKTCDVVLKLDDGTELPVHSQVLARCPPVFFGMLDGGPLSEASASKVVSVPFSECSVKEAQCFLSIIYSLRGSEHIDIHSALSLARLSHKYGVEVCTEGLLIYMHACLKPPPIVLITQSAKGTAGMVKLCDSVLGETAGINSDVERVPPYLKVCKALIRLTLCPACQPLLRD